MKINENIWKDCITPKDGERLGRGEVHVVRTGDANLNRKRKSRGVTTSLVIPGLNDKKTQYCNHW